MPSGLIVWFARSCGKVYSRHLVFLMVDQAIEVKNREMNVVTKDISGVHVIIT